MKPPPFVVVLEVNRYLNGIDHPQSLSTISFLSSDYCHNFICFHLLDPWALIQKLFRLILFIYTKVKYSNSSYFQIVIAMYIFEIHIRPKCLHHNNHFI